LSQANRSRDNSIVSNVSIHVSDVHSNASARDNFNIYFNVIDVLDRATDTVLENVLWITKPFHEGSRGPFVQSNPSTRAPPHTWSFQEAGFGSIRDNASNFEQNNLNVTTVDVTHLNETRLGNNASTSLNKTLVPIQTDPVSSNPGNNASSDSNENVNTNLSVTNRSNPGSDGASSTSSSSETSSGDPTFVRVDTNTRAQPRVPQPGTVPTFC